MHALVPGRPFWPTYLISKRNIRAACAGETMAISLLAVIVQVLEQMPLDGLEPNEFSLTMVLQAANYKRKGLHKARVLAQGAQGQGLVHGSHKRKGLHKVHVLAQGACACTRRVCLYRARVLAFGACACTSRQL